MTVQIPPMPQPPAEMYEEAPEEQWAQYRGDVHAWLLRYKELPKVLSEQELQVAQQLSDDALFERYIAVADGGPLGGVWYNQLIAMRELLNRNWLHPRVQRRFTDDFVKTYTEIWNTPWPKDHVGPTLMKRVEEEGLIGAYWPDVDSYYSGVVFEFYYNTRAMARFQKRARRTGDNSDFHRVGEAHAWMTALAPVIAEFPHFDAARASHDEFVARWNLPTENVPTAGSKAQ